MGYDPLDVLSARSPGDVRAHLDRARESWNGAKAVRNAKKRYDQLIGLLDERKRTGTLFDLGVEGLQKLIESVVGPIGNHPYWVYHKAHFKVLKSVVEAGQRSRLAAAQFDEALKIVKRIDAESRTVLESYSTSGEKYKALMWSFNAVLLRAWLVRGSVEANLKSGSGQRVIEDLWQLNTVVRTVHKSARDPVDEMSTMLGSLWQDRAAVDLLTSASKKTLESLENKDRFGQVVSLSEQERQQLASLLDNYPDDLVLFVDSAIARVSAVQEKWIAKIDKFDDDLYRLDVLSAFKPRH